MDGDEADDFKFLFAGRSGDFDFVADLAIEEGLANGRGGGDETLFGVGFLGTDKLVFDLYVALGVEHGESGTVTGAILGNVGEIEHAEIAHALLELGDTGVNVTLALLGVLVLGVFGEVAVGARDGDFLGELNIELVGELIDFVEYLLLDLG